MKKILVLALTLVSLISCGKKSTTAGVGYSTSPIASINSDSGFQSLGQTIDSNNFGGYVGVQYFSEYHFGEVTNTCVKKDGWFGMDYMSCNGVASNETIVYQGDGNVDAKRSELNGILSKTVQFQGNGVYYSLRTSDNITYVIRTDYPMKANPVYEYNNVTGKAKQLLYIKP